MLNKIKLLFLTISISLIIISVPIFLLGIQSCRYDCNCSKMCRKEVCCSKKCDELLQFLKIDSCPDKSDVSNFKFEKIDETNKNNKIVYLNKEFGFKLTLTENWENYHVDLKKDENVIYIKFFNREDSNLLSLFQIAIYDIGYWDESIKVCEKNPDSNMICNWIDKKKELIRNDKYVFSGGITLQDDCPSIYKLAFNDIEKIIQSIELTK